MHGKNEKVDHNTLGKNRKVYLIKLNNFRLATVLLEKESLNLIRKKLKWKLIINF